MNKTKLEAIIDSYVDSLNVVAHNPVETRIVMQMIHEYQRGYRARFGEYYIPREMIRDRRLEK